MSKTNNSGKPWENQIQSLENMASYFSVTAIAKTLGRTERAVREKANYYGIPLKK